MYSLNGFVGATIPSLFETIQMSEQTEPAVCLHTLKSLRVSLGRTDALLRSRVNRFKAFGDLHMKSLESKTFLQCSNQEYFSMFQPMF